MYARFSVYSTSDFHAFGVYDAQRRKQIATRAGHWTTRDEYEAESLAHVLEAGIRPTWIDWR